MADAAERGSAAPTGGGSGYKAVSLDELDMRFHYPVYCRTYETQHTKRSKIKRNLTFNGLFLPAKGEGIVQMASPKTVQFYRKRESCIMMRQRRRHLLQNGMFGLQ